MKIENLEQSSLILLKCISGSKAYGLNTPQSDTDIKGVFVVPKHTFYGLKHEEQINNETNDIVYYELRRFIELLLLNNPNILELLATPKESILFKHPIMEQLKPELFLSKLCMHTFAGYAQSQINKAKGLNKKIVNPIEKERKSILDFCYVINGQGSQSLKQWLLSKEMKQEECGLVNVPHMKDIYSLFHNSQLKDGHLSGISSGTDANDISLSSIPKDISPITTMSFNKDGYSKYCKDYKAYWDWVEKRNEIRYENTIDQGKNYDAKNMMHTFRLLNMAEEIAVEKRINVRRPDRDFLLSIRSGSYEYDQLVEMAREKISRIEGLFLKSDLPESPNTNNVEELLIQMRTEWYKGH